MSRGREALEKSEAQKRKKGVHEKQTPLFLTIDLFTAPRRDI